MRIAYFDCFSGAAGDMIVAACLDAGAPQEVLREQLGHLRLDEAELHIEKVNKKGIAATSFEPRLRDTSTASCPHRTFETIVTLIEQAHLSDQVKGNAIKIFTRLAEAEAKVHGTSPADVVFHELGAVDAIIDIVGSCVALEALKLDKVYCSPLITGSGMVECAHGILPIPAPATAELIRGVPLGHSEASFELLTPTGAAILTTLAAEFGAMPAMSITDIGYGAGQYDNPDMANVLRVLIGETIEQAGDRESDEVYLLEANVDDATAELIGHVTEKLLGAGALDVYCTAIMMKKNRPGTLLSVICQSDDAAKLERLIFLESTTFGIRRQLCHRSILTRAQQTVETVFGPIGIKTGRLDGRTATCSVEFEDCREAAERHGVPVKDVMSAAMAAYKQAD